MPNPDAKTRLPPECRRGNTTSSGRACWEVAFEMDGTDSEQGTFFGRRHVQVARSADGLSWTPFEPVRIDRYTVSAFNNIYFFAVRAIRLSGGEELLLALYPAVFGAEGEETGGVFCSVSRDGVHWSQPHRILASHVFDGVRTDVYPVDTSFGSPTVVDAAQLLLQVAIQHRVHLADPEEGSEACQHSTYIRWYTLDIRALLSPSALGALPAAASELPSISPHSSAFVSRSALPDAERPAAAFVLAGGLAGALSKAALLRYRTNLVDSLGGGVSFVVLALVPSGETRRLSATQTPRLSATQTPRLSARDLEGPTAQLIRSVLSPAAMRVTAIDEAANLWANRSAIIADCLYRGSGYYQQPGARALLLRRLARWWGKLQMAHEMVATYERTRHLVFPRVVLTRPDIDFHAPVQLPAQSTPHADDELAWYSAANPPDGFWIMPRVVANHAMQTASYASHCSGTLASLATRGVSGPYLYSWFIPCHWALQLWERGVRLRVLGNLNATVREHPAASGWDDADGILRSVSIPPEETSVDFDVAGRLPIPVGEGVCSPWRPSPPAEA